MRQGRMESRAGTVSAEGDPLRRLKKGNPDGLYGVGRERNEAVGQPLLRWETPTSALLVCRNVLSAKCLRMYSECIQVHSCGRIIPVFSSLSS